MRIPRDISGEELVKIGTINSILVDIADYLKIDKKTLIDELFER